MIRLLRTPVRHLMWPHWSLRTSCIWCVIMYATFTTYAMFTTYSMFATYARTPYDMAALIAIIRYCVCYVLQCCHSTKLAYAYFILDKNVAQNYSYKSNTPATRLTSKHSVQSIRHPIWPTLLPVKEIIFWIYCGHGEHNMHSFQCGRRLKKSIS